MVAEDCITQHTVAIHERGGVRRVAALTNLSMVQWERVRDDFTRSIAEISGQYCARQASALEMIEPRFHELVIYRGASRVWEGPILDVRWFSNRVQIVADDAGEYVNNAPCTIDWPGPEGGGEVYMTERARAIITYELSNGYDMDVGLTAPEIVAVPAWEQLDPPANVLPHLDVRASVGPGGILTTADVEAFQMTVGEHLKNLARGGLDFTVVGRRLIVWDSAEALGRTRPVTEADFLGELEVVASGADHASIAHMVAPGGSDEDGEDLPPAVGNAGAPDPFYGVWTDLRTREDEEGADTPSQEELNTQARRLLVGRNPVPTRIITHGGLRLGTGLSIDDLVPGIVLPVRAVLNLRQVAQNQVLDRLSVTETPEGETINVDLMPAGPLEVLG